MGIIREMWNVLIIAENIQSWDGIRYLLEHDQNIQTPYGVVCKDEALQILQRKKDEIDFVVFHLCTLSVIGMDLMRSIRQCHPYLNILVLTTFSDDIIDNSNYSVNKLSNILIDYPLDKAHNEMKLYSDAQRSITNMIARFIQNGKNNREYMS